MLSQWLSVDADSVLEIRATSIFRVEVCRVGEFLCRLLHGFMPRKPMGVSVASGLIGSVEEESKQMALLTATKYINILFYIWCCEEVTHPRAHQT
jgi:hypothetical protein